MKQVIKGDLQAMDRVMKAIDRRARIYGFEAPQKVAHTTPDGEEAQQQGIVVVSSPMTSEEWLEKYMPNSDS